MAKKQRNLPISLKMDKERKISLYKGMLRIRIIEEQLVCYYAEQEMRCPVHFSIGQEAVSVGVCQALELRDSVMSNHRSHGNYLAKGGNLKTMVAELYGRQEGCSFGKGGSMHLIDLSVNFLGATSIVSSTIPVAVGVGFANKLQNKDAVSVVFFGDGATEEGLFYESLNFAALHKVPVLFVCENNFYAVYAHLSVRQPESRKIYNVANALGVDSVVIDGNDVELVYLTAKKALDDIRNGKGPFLIEANTYRWLEHCGPNYDNDLGYREEAEFLKWKDKDPVATHGKKLFKGSVISEKLISDFKKEFSGEVIEAVNYAKSLPFPKNDEAIKGVYAE